MKSLCWSKTVQYIIIIYVSSFISVSSGRFYQGDNRVIGVNREEGDSRSQGQLPNYWSQACLRIQFNGQLRLIFSRSHYDDVEVWSKEKEVFPDNTIHFPARFDNGHGYCNEDGSTQMNVTWRDTGTSSSKIASKKRQFSLAFNVSTMGSTGNTTWGLESITLRFNDSLGNFHTLSTSQDTVNPFIFESPQNFSFFCLSHLQFVLNKPESDTSKLKSAKMVMWGLRMDVGDFIKTDIDGEDVTRCKVDLGLILSQRHLLPIIIAILILLVVVSVGLAYLYARSKDEKLPYKSVD